MSLQEATLLPGGALRAYAAIHRAKPLIEMKMTEQPGEFRERMPMFKFITFRSQLVAGLCILDHPFSHHPNL